MKRPMHEKLREYVDAHHLVQKKIAADMGISAPRVSLMLNGKRGITVDDYFDFCRALKINPVMFYESA